MNRLLFFFLCIVAIPANAQNCNDNDVTSMPGTWREGLKGTQTGGAAEIAKEKRLTALLHDNFKRKYSPVGVEATYYSAYSAPAGNIPCNNFSYGIYAKHYHCSNGVVKTWEETSTTFSVYANYFESEIFDTAKGGRALSEGFNVMYQMPVFKNGYWYFPEKDQPLGFSLTGKRQMWLITHDGQLPYAYVTRKEFLEKRRRSLAVQMEESAQSIRDVLKNIEIEKKFREEEYKNDPAKMEKYMKMDYLQVKERYQKFLADNEKKFRPAFDKLEAELRKPADELNRQAIVKNDPNDFANYLFTDENDPFANILIKPNPAYFDKKLSPAAPQFFWIYLKGYHKDPVAVRFMQDIAKAIDFDMLQQMVGKNPAENAVVKKTAPTPAVNKAIQIVRPAAFDVYKNEPAAGFTPTPASEIKNAAPPLPLISNYSKGKALGTLLNSSNAAAYINQLFTDIEKNLSQQQQKNTAIIYSKCQNNMTALADAGVMLYYKGAINEALWCLGKAAAAKPGSDYIISNLTAIMNLSGAEARALPLLRYLKTKQPGNSTVLNNLGQAFYALGETAQAKNLLDSCLSKSQFHPQANFTRAIIAEKEGKNAEAEHFIQKSLKGAYSDHTDEFAKRKKIKTDYSNILKRYHPTNAEYINPLNFLPPQQCTAVLENAAKEAEWDEWAKAIQQVIAKINAGMAAAAANTQKEMQKQLQNKTVNSFFQFGILSGKADKLYKVFLDKIAALQTEAQTYTDGKYKSDKNMIEKEYDDKMKSINEKYGKMGGEGSGSSEEARCREVNAAGDLYLQKMAGINDAFNARFSEPLRMLNIEAMYWSQFLPLSAGAREGLYYDRAVFAVSPMMMKSAFKDPCGAKEKGAAKSKEADIPAPYCPVSLKFKVTVAKLTIDCSKIDVELEYDGIVLNLERDFVNRKSTIALGAGASLDLSREEGDIGEYVDAGGGGVGVKMQGFIEWDGKGISDIGLRGEAGIEGVLTDKGDLKVSGKLGVNSGVDISVTPGVSAIGKALSNF